MQEKQPVSHGILTPIQRNFLTQFRTLPDAEAFYLTGGTALAEFYFGHRLSFDLDFFTTETGLIRPFSLLMEDALRQHGFTLKPVRRMETFAEYEAQSGGTSVRIQLAYDSPFRFAPPMRTPLGLVNDYLDLTVDKLLAFFGRAEPRDAVDLYFILQETDFRELVDMAARKDPGFDLYWMAHALMKVSSFPDEGERWPVQVLKPFDAVALKQQFADLAHRLLADIQR